MATLWVRDGYQAGFERKISAYTSKLCDISDQYYSAERIVNDYTGDSDVSSCNVYLRKRRNSLQDSVSAANSLKKKANTYVDNIISADKTVASTIHKDSYSFYKKKGIGPQKDSWIARAWNSVKTTASDFWHDAKETTKRIIQDVKDFYEEYKYLFNIAADFLKIVAALALFAVAGTTFIGIICFIGAMWALTKATYELATDCLAAEAWLNGDDAKAEDLANRTLTGDLIKAGEWLDQKLGTHFIETTFKVVLGGLEVCEFVAELMLLFDAFKQIFNLKLASNGKPLRALDPNYHATWAESIRNWKMVNWGGTLGNGARFASVTNWLKFGGWSLKFSFAKDAKSTTDFIFSLFDNKSKNLERVKTIIKDPSSILKNLPGIKESNELGKTIAGIILA